MAGIASAEIAPTVDVAFGRDGAGGLVSKEASVGAGSGGLAIDAAFEEDGEADGPGLEADEMGRAVIDFRGDDVIAPMQGLVALERAVVEDGAALSAEEVNVAEELGMGLGRAGGGAGAGGAAAHVALGGDAAESVAAGGDADEGAGVGDELVECEVAPTGRAAFGIEGAEFATRADQVGEAGAVGSRAARQRPAPAGDLALGGACASVVPPGVDDDLDEVGAVGRQELSEAGEVEVDLGIAGQDALNGGPGVGVASAPAGDRSV